MNPVENLWATGSIMNCPMSCPRELWQLSEGARRTLRCLRRRPRLITAFWKQVSLFNYSAILCDSEVSVVEAPNQPAITYVRAFVWHTSYLYPD
jgi:hypothetical protein